jgi:amino acid transporter
MFYMALSLSLIAGGIILLYLLWMPSPAYGETLNAVVFSKILTHWSDYWKHLGLLILLLAETGILIVAANTGFLGGPAVLANMAVDSWAPKRFGLLSSRLVTQNGLILFGASATIILIATDGDVSFLVVLYSINVFITFTLSMLGLTRHWWKERHNNKSWQFQFSLALIGLIVCLMILASTLISKFESGGWITLSLTGAIVALGLKIRQHYHRFNAMKTKLNETLRLPIDNQPTKPIAIQFDQPTAVFLVAELGAAMHSILWVLRMFPNYFKNFVFISHGEVDIGNFGSLESLEALKQNTHDTLDYLSQFSAQQQIASEYFVSYGTDPVDHIFSMAAKVNQRYDNTIYFSSRYLYPGENWFSRQLHSDMTSVLQRRLQTLGVKMLVLPLKLM